MKIKNAWALSEMVIAITILIFLSGIAAAVLKSNVRQERFFVYATIKNIEKANAYLIDQTEDEIIQPNVNGKDWYCANLADIFALKGSANCTATAGGNTTTINMTLANGVNLYGFSNPWKDAYTGSDVKIKDILIDINGAKGPNKNWIDRFPLRVYAGEIYTGVVRAVNCGDDFINDDEGVKHSVSKNIFCGTDTTNYLQDEAVITYDILKPINVGEEDDEGTQLAQVKTLVSSASAFAADCIASGGKGMFNRAQCKAGGYRLHLECISEDACEGCTAGGTCPLKADNTTVMDEAACISQAQSANPDGHPCTTALHKPMAGLSSMLSDIINEVDM